MTRILRGCGAVICPECRQLVMPIGDAVTEHRNYQYGESCPGVGTVVAARRESVSA